jgi:hypothetical protein
MPMKLLREKIERLEPNHPLRHRRSRR